MNNVKKNLTMLFLLTIFFLVNINIKAQQSFTCVVDTNVIVDTVGSEMIFYLDITNTSTHPLILIIARTVNDLPSEWTSSLCYDINCLPPFVDTVISNNDPLDPDSTVECSLHVTAIDNHGTAHVHLVVGNYNDLTDTVGYDFTASTEPLTVVKNGYSPASFSLNQNYPNPFNPTTNIQYSISSRQFVSLKVYNILGEQVAALVNEEKSPGTYILNFNGSNLASGTYFYRLTAGSNVTTKKMILLK